MPCLTATRHWYYGFPRWILIVLVILVEIWTTCGTFGILFIRGDLLFIIYVTTTPIRVLFFVIAAFLCDPSHWWYQFFTVDGGNISLVGSMIAYCALVESHTEASIGWKVAAMVAYVVLYASLDVEVRTITKYFKWHKFTIWLYKMNRGFALLLFLLIEVISHVLESIESGEDIKLDCTGTLDDLECEQQSEEEGQFNESLQILWVLVTMHYLHGLFELVAEKEHEVWHEKDESSSTSTPSTSDGSADEKTNSTSEWSMEEVN